MSGFMSTIWIAAGYVLANVIERVAPVGGYVILGAGALLLIMRVPIRGVRTRLIGTGMLLASDIVQDAINQAVDAVVEMISPSRGEGA